MYKRQSRQLQRLLSHYPDTVKLIFSGHLHMDGMRFISRGKRPSLMDSYVPSISPIFGNHPGFKYYQYLPSTGEVIDYQTVSRTKTGVWQRLYDYQRVYQPNCHGHCTLASAMWHHGQFQLTGKMNQKVHHFSQFYGLGAKMVSWFVSLFWPTFHCGLTHLTDQAFHQCLVAGRAA